MNRGDGRPLRIAHAFGNRRHRIEAAIAADVDYIEADLWYRAGEIWVRHERRLGSLPILYDRKPRGMNRFGPWSLTVFPNHYIRLDIRPLRLVELLEATRGKRRLLLDPEYARNDQYRSDVYGCQRRSRPTAGDTASGDRSSTRLLRGTLCWR